MVVLATRDWAAPERAGSSAQGVILVHGVAGWRRTWWRVGPALAERGWRVVGVDLRGHGHSPRIEGHATISDLAADVAATMERAGTSADALIGHSLGAAVGAELAYLRPDLVGRLVLEDPPAITRAGDVTWLSNLQRELIAAHTDFDAEVARELATNPAWLEEDARQDVEGKQLADRDGILASFRRDTGARVLELAPRLAIPALYLLAAEDRSAFPREARRQLRATLPADARLRVFDAGHTIHRDQFDTYMAVVLDWLAQGARQTDPA